MAYFKRFFFLLLVSIVSIGVAAEENKNQPKNNSSKAGKTVLINVGDFLQKKRMPSRVNIEITYADGMVSMTSEYEETVLNLTFTNLHTGESETIPSISIGEYVPMDLETGSYELSAEKSDGGSFSGVMEIYDL